MQSYTHTLAGTIENVARYSRMESNNVTVIPENPEIPLRLRAINIPYVPLVSDLQKESVKNSLKSVYLASAVASKVPLAVKAGVSVPDFKSRPLSPLSADDNLKCVRPPPSEPDSAQVTEEKKSNLMDNTSTVHPEGDHRAAVPMRMVDTKRLTGHELTIDQLVAAEELRNKLRQRARHKKREEKKKCLRCERMTSSAAAVNDRTCDSVSVQVADTDVSRPQSASSTCSVQVDPEPPSVAKDTTGYQSSRRGTYTVVTNVT